MIGTLRGRCLLFAMSAIVVLSTNRGFGATPTTVTGEVVETYCWAVHQVGGAGHAQCGIECAKRGLPVALYDQKSHKAFILLPARDKSSLPADLVAAMGQRISVRGEIQERGGIQFLIVGSWQRLLDHR